jgi:hypothetical protein
VPWCLSNLWRVCGLGLLLLTLAGCAPKPWVMPYERARLADPVMESGRQPLSEGYVTHMHQSREGARGAESGGGGGCGCN